MARFLNNVVSVRSNSSQLGNLMKVLPSQEAGQGD